MARLIDADELNKDIEQQMESIFTDESWATQMTLFVAEKILHLVNRQPTAYDVEKVVEELERAESVKLYGSRNSGNYMIPLKDAIDIVRKGGV